MHRRRAGRIGAWKDESLAVEAGAFDADESEAAPRAISCRNTDPADHPAAKPHRFDDAQVVSGEVMGLLGPDIVKVKIDVMRHPRTLTIQPSTLSQQSVG